MTSAGFSPALGRGVALGMVRRGRVRLGEEFDVVTGAAKGARVRIIPLAAYDIGGDRLNG